MDASRDDLVAFALGSLPPEETGRIAAEVASDPALARELKEIERHLRLHAKAPRIEPAPALWEGIRSRLEEPAAPRSLLRRFRLPLAAAALIAIALFWPSRAATEPVLVTLHGDVVRNPDGAYVTTGVSRVRTPQGVTITLDAGTDFRLDSKRLALGAGRVFLEVPSGARGFTVVAGDLVAETTGTAFLVERGEPSFVWTESGHVRCSWRDRERIAGPGEIFFASDAPSPHVASAARVPPLSPSPRSWFSRPSLDARTLDAQTVRVTLTNAMPDPIRVAPSPSGEPLFFARYGGHDYPLVPDGFQPATLEPGARKSFDLRLPRPIEDGEALVVSYAKGDVSAEARR